MSDREQTAITAAADAILTARDFCGDEREAAVDAIADQGVKPTKTMVLQAFSEANGEWAEKQKAAGVRKPISHGERAKIYRAMR